ncbi:hypothetical protein DPMN_057047 [Dreissena polymorpha]|uniref:B box-type domain-containing protein n=1 Tax=Dreissena polymorpha TaxID=45954 RepID=A0A9D4CTP7_DREPO|nr:hypothetical protein DPMN_057047 [Dreissena polymorpha]
MASAGLNDSNRGSASDFLEDCTATQTCEPCMKTNTSKAATLFCKDCQELLCETCRNPHIAYKSGNHDIVTQENVVGMKGMDRCKEHGMLFEFFCEDHSKLCCPTCVFTHRRCEELNEISSISLQVGAELDNWKQCLLMLESDADANMIDCKQSEKQLNESIIDISKEVDDLGDRLIKQIEEAKRDFLTQAHALKCEEVKRLNDRHDLNTKIKDEIFETLQFFLAISKKGTFQQKYIFLKQIEEKCKKVESEINEQRTTQVSTKVTFSYPRELSPLLGMGNNFFKVNLERSGTILKCIPSRRSLLYL